MNKKAFEIQFNWIFVLVAGAAILLFFTVVVVKWKNVSESSTKATVLKSIEAIVIGAGVSTDTISIISIPNSNIEASCGRISLGGISKQYQNAILFAPSLIKGDKLITQTSAFGVPYRAANLLYMTSPRIRYIIIGDTELAKDLNKSMPSNLKKEFYQSLPESIRNENNYKIKFVFFGNIDKNFLKNLEKMPDSDVTAINVAGDKEKGKIEFYQKDGTSWLSKGASAYIGKASLLGAIYTDTLEMYECNMQNTFARLHFITKIYAEKTKKLMQISSVSTRQIQCSEFYNRALAQLNRIYAASSGIGIESVNEIADSAKLLSNENKNAQVYSCTLIY